MSERATCLAPGCRRTTGRVTGEWICGKHWQMVPKADRRVLSDTARKYRRQFGDQAYWQFPPGSANRLAAVELYHEWQRIWGTIRDNTIVAAFMDPMA